MKILVTNDDGIMAPGIAELARAAREFGEVTVIAPREQCSAMSHHITLHRPMAIEERKDFPVEGVRAFSLDGTPADCVRTLTHGMFDMDRERKKSGGPDYLKVNPDLPDLVLSGINHGANAGHDIVYSATVGAAMEAVMCGVPAICFSQLAGRSCEVREKYLPGLLGELIRKKTAPGEIFNVNFPDCPLSEFQGILRDRKLDSWCLYNDHYDIEDGQVKLVDRMRTEGDIETDIGAVLAGYISVGIIRNPVFL